MSPESTCRHRVRVQITVTHVDDGAQYSTCHEFDLSGAVKGGDDTVVSKLVSPMQQVLIDAALGSGVVPIGEWEDK